MEKVKPILYIDVDGVLFGLYGEPLCFQLRPGVNSFLRWATDHFECWWLTGWPPKELYQLLKRIYAANYLEPTYPKYANWYAHGRKQRRTHPNKTAAIQWDREWLWLEDGIGKEIESELDSRGCLHRYIYVNHRGADALERVRQVLAERLATLETTNKEAHS